VLVTVGVGAISLATLLLSPVSKFPGFIALLPVAGTALIILFGRQLKVCNGFLSSKQLVYIGDISYSLYLWHWPFIVFARVIWPATQGVAAIAAALSFIPAGLSYRFVETRLRSKPTGERKYGKTILAFVAIVPLVFSFGLQKAANTGLGITRVEDGNDNYAAQLDADCGEYQESFETKCASKTGKSSFLVYLYGDSNANAASTGVAEAVFELGGALVVANGSGCPFLSTAAMKKCESFNEIRFESIKRSRPDLVIIVNLQSNYLLNEIYQPWSKSENMLESLSETLLLLDNLGIPAIVQGEIPFCDFKVNLLSRYSLKRQSCWRNYDKQLEHLEFLVETERLTKDFARHHFFDPRLTVCPKESCTPFFDERWIFSDRAHLSPAGSRMLTPIYIDAIKKVLEQK
jgi:hypothetical protein